MIINITNLLSVYDIIESTALVCCVCVKEEEEPPIENSDSFDHILMFYISQSELDGHTSAIKVHYVLL